jgi:protein SCO1/2
VAQAYDVYYAKLPADSTGRYAVDHTTTVMVLDRDGLLRLLWSFGTEPEQMAHDLRILI